LALFQSDSGDPGEAKAQAAEGIARESHLERRLIRDGSQVIAHGSMICPECDLPLPGRPAVSASLMLTCSWCGHRAPAWALFQAGAADTPANAVSLVARLT
jgi:hypothetical protein